ncbi:hypothetical protein LTS02_017218 [Friedmanniomyces endolithicus]|nr:hypothetical protein LTS02_017218 [Friedmanniomyces endolithicus]
MATDTPNSVSSTVTKQDVNLFEVFAADSGAFRRTLFTYVDTDERAWAGEAHKIRKYDLTDEYIRVNLQKIPDHDAFPKMAQDISLVLPQHSDATELFFKRPQIHCLLEEFGGSIVPQMLLEEAQKILGHLFYDDASGIDLDRFERQCRDAIDYIHSLGLAHNDLNPSNIALDRNNDPVIIDWGSCKEFGELLLSAGTPGWIQDEFDVSRKEHDLYALDKIMAWMREEKAKSTKP